MRALSTKWRCQDLENRLEPEFDLELLEKAKKNVRRRLQPRSWSAYVETVERGRTAAEVARELGMTVGAVHQEKHRVLTALRHELETMEGDAVDVRVPESSRRHTDASFPTRVQGREIEEMEGDAVDERPPEWVRRHTDGSFPTRAQGRGIEEMEDDAADAPTPESIRRHTDISFPAKVHVGKTYNLRVQIVAAEKTLPTGEIKELLKPHPHDVTMSLLVPKPAEARRAAAGHSRDHRSRR